MSPVDSWDAADAADNLRADITRALVDDTRHNRPRSRALGADRGPSPAGWTGLLRAIRLLETVTMDAMRTHCPQCHDDTEVDWQSAGFYHLVCGHVAHPVAFPPCKCGHRYPDSPPAGLTQRRESNRTDVFADWVPLDPAIFGPPRAEELQAKLDQVRRVALEDLAQLRRRYANATTLGHRGGLAAGINALTRTLDILGSGGTSDPDAALDALTAAEVDAPPPREWQDYQGRDQR